MAQASPPSFVICATVCSESAIRLAVTMTFAPSAPNRSAIALPIPLLLPVTIATLSLSRCMWSPYKRKKCSFQACLFLVVTGGPIGLLLRATFSPTHPLARRDVPLTRTRAFQSPLPLFKGVAKAALYCAHRTSTVSPCAFCEQEGHLAAPCLNPPVSLCRRSIFRDRWGTDLSSEATMWRRRSWRCSRKDRRRKS